MTASSVPSGPSAPPIKNLAFPFIVVVSVKEPASIPSTRASRPSTLPFKIANSEPSSSLSLVIAAPFIKPSPPAIRLFSSTAASKREIELPSNLGLFVRSFKES